MYRRILVGTDGSATAAKAVARAAGASRFLLGSVPNKVSHHSPCPLLIVHTT